MKRILFCLLRNLKKTVIEIGEENQSDVLDYCYTSSWLAEIITTGFTITALSDVIMKHAGKLCMQTRAGETA